MAVIGLASAGVFLENDITPQVPHGFSFLGKPSAQEMTTLLVVLKSQNMEKLTEELYKTSTPGSPDYGRHWTYKQVSDFTKPTTASITAVVSWLNKFGITHIEQSGAAEVLIVRANIAQVESALGVSMVTYVCPEGRTYFRSMDKYSVPEHIAEHIMMIDGINRLPVRPRARTPSTSIASAFGQSPTPVTPQSIRKLYRISMPSQKPSVVQAVVSFLGQYWAPADLAGFQFWAGLLVKPIAHLQGFNIPAPSAAGVEASLDVDYLTGIPEYVDTWVWSTNGTIANGNEPWLVFLTGIANYIRAVGDEGLPSVWSMSYQDLEFTVSRAYAISVCQMFQKFTMTGFTFVTGSGDWGVGCNNEQGASCSRFTADFPSSCPYVTSLGGTYVNSNGVEVSVDFSSGGFSDYFPQPAYQKDAVNAYLRIPSVRRLAPFYNASGRAFPDLSTVSTNFQVYYQGKIIPVAGTSAATPTFAAMVTILNDHRIAANLPTMGFINPFLYTAYAASADSFTDITSGDQQMTGCCGTSFAAIHGYDAVTGLGSPMFDILDHYALNPSLLAKKN